jgi:hypothetical protein
MNNFWSIQMELMLFAFPFKADIAKTPENFVYGIKF